MKIELTEKELRSYNPPEVDPSKVETVHLIGIGGMGMGTLAGLLQEAGYSVRGSDNKIYPPMSHQLEKLSIPTVEGYRPENLEPPPDLVIVGNACRPSNPEVQAAIARGIPATSLPRALRDFFLRGRTNLVIAGTHGKTTTTTLTAFILERAGLEPGLFVGGIALNYQKSYLLPKSQYFVLEGDEYDSALFDKVPKFVHYLPTMAVLTSVEFDHADIYSNLREVKKAFRKLVTSLPKEGKLLVCGHYPNALEVAKESTAPVMTYGLEGEFDYTARNIRWEEEGGRFELCARGESLGEFLLPLFGDFNIQNAVSSIALALEVGVSADRIREILPQFRGVKRRQEIAAKIGEIVIIDDFAHHPTAVEKTIAAVKQRFPSRRVWAVFEPRSNTSRRKIFQKDYVKALSKADAVVLAAPFGAEKLPPNQRFDPEAAASELEKAGISAAAFPAVEAIADFLVAKARPDDVFLIMSNGDFGGLIPKLIEGLERRYRHPLQAPTQ